MTHYKIVKAKALQSGKTIKEIVEALRMASEFALTHSDPIDHVALRSLYQANPLAFEIYGASRLDNAGGKVTP